MKYVYHGSSTPNLKIIKTNKSTYMKKWVYACASKAISTIFLSPLGNDLYYSLSGDGINYPVELVERKSGMFKEIFNCAGYIYKLDASNFKSGQTGWSAEVVSEKDEKVIEKYFEFFLDEYRLDKYLKNVVISNFKNNSIAYYSPDTKTIYINFCKMIYALGLESKQCKYTDTYKDKIMMINLYIVKIIAHEIEHVLQERKINSGIYNIENDILSVANIHEKYLKANGIYKGILYYANPIERQAELKSLKSILQVANEIDRLNIVNLITNEYLTKTISDYSIEGQQIIYPYKVFFDKKFDMEYLLNIIRKIEEMEILDCNEDLRIDMGLKLISQEIHKIRRKLKEC